MFPYYNHTYNHHLSNFLWHLHNFFLHACFIMLPQDAVMTTNEDELKWRRAES